MLDLYKIFTLLWLCGVFPWISPQTTTTTTTTQNYNFKSQALPSCIITTYFESENFGISESEKLNITNFIIENNLPVESVLPHLKNFLLKNVRCSQPCGQCVTTEKLRTFFNGMPNTSLTYMSQMVIFLTLKASNLCDNYHYNDSCRNSSCITTTLRSTLGLDETTLFTFAKLDHMLEVIGLYYKPQNDTPTPRKCIDSYRLLDIIMNNWPVFYPNHSKSSGLSMNLDVLYVMLSRHLLKGNCISTLNDTNVHLHRIFSTFGYHPNLSHEWQQRLNETGFSLLIYRLNNATKHCISSTNSKRKVDNANNIRNVNGRPQEAVHDHSVHHGHDNEHYHHHSHRKKRHAITSNEDDSANFNPNMNNSECLDWKALFQTADLDRTNDVDIQEFLYLCPTIIDHWIGTTQDMQKKIVNSSNTEFAGAFNTEAYGYGTLAVAIISICSLAGVLIIPCMKSSLYNYFMSVLIAMGVGILVGDAVLHLIPQALGLHEIIHNADTGDHDHDHSSGTSYLGKCIAILGAIYGLFLFEGLSHALVPNHHHHHHNHNEDENENKKTDGKFSVLDINNVDVYSKDHKTISLQTLTTHEGSTASNEGPNSMSEQDISVEDSLDSNTPELAVKSPVICCGLKSLAIIITLGDSIHNFADGLVIGAAFASGNRGGLSTSLAILCHELPHEFGDFAILLTTGLSKKKVIIINLLSSLTAFIGLYIGLVIGSDEVTVQWTMAITAGMFIFVALGDMMPELKALLSTTSPYISLLLQNIGMLIGFGFIILMSVYENEIHI